MYPNEAGEKKFQDSLEGGGRYRKSIDAFIIQSQTPSQLVVLFFIFYSFCSTLEQGSEQLRKQLVMFLNKKQYAIKGQTISRHQLPLTRWLCIQTVASFFLSCGNRYWESKHLSQISFILYLRHIF